MSEGRGGLVRTFERGGEGLRMRLQERMHLAFGDHVDAGSSKPAIDGVSISLEGVSRSLEGFSRGVVTTYFL